MQLIYYAARKQKVFDNELQKMVGTAREDRKNIGAVISADTKKGNYNYLFSLPGKYRQYYVFLLTCNIMIRCSSVAAFGSSQSQLSVTLLHITNRLEPRD